MFFEPITEQDLEACTKFITKYCIKAKKFYPQPSYYLAQICSQWFTCLVGSRTSISGDAFMLAANHLGYKIEQRGFPARCWYICLGLNESLLAKDTSLSIELLCAAHTFDRQSRQVYELSRIVPLHISDGVRVGTGDKVVGSQVGGREMINPKKMSVV